MEQNETTVVPQDELTDRIANRLGARQQKLEQMEQWDKTPAKKSTTRLRPLFIGLAVAACLAAVVWVAPWQSSTNPLDELGIGTPEITVYRSASSDAAAINALINDEKYEEALDMVTAALSHSDDEVELAEEYAEAFGDDEAIYDTMLAYQENAQLRWMRIYLLMKLEQKKDAKRELKTYLRYREFAEHVEEAEELRKALK